MADKEKIAGEILGGMGPGLLSGIGAALNPAPPSGSGSASAGPKTPPIAKPKMLKHGGKVQKTGIALVHKGETVIPANDHDDDDEPAPNISLHRALHHLNKGGLHRALGVPEGTDIPKDKLSAAKKSTNPHVAKMAQFAGTMEGWKH